MIKSKLHNPIIAKNSQLENAVVEKVNLISEQLFSDLSNVVPVVPETGRIWFNSETGSFKFANLGVGGDGKNFVDEFLSKTDKRHQTVIGKVDFADTVKVNSMVDGGSILTVDSETEDVTIDGHDLTITLTGDKTLNITGDEVTNITGTRTTILNGDETLTVNANRNHTITGTSTLKVVGDSFETYDVNKTETVKGNSFETVTLNKNLSVTGNLNETIGGLVNTTVTGNVTEIFLADQTTSISGNLGIKVSKVATLLDGANNVKIEANNTTDTLTVNYSSIFFNGQTERHTLTDIFAINDGISDKFIIDHVNNKVTIIYDAFESTTTNTTFNTTNKLKVTDGSVDKIVADHLTDTLQFTYGETTFNGNTVVDGNMVVTGDLTVGGQTTKVDIAAENMRIADNVIILNSNLTTEDPRLASAIIDGEDVDNNAGVAVNRGSEGILDLITWIESTDLSSTETLKSGTANVSIWNYEAATPSYELHQIIDAYTLGRQTIGKSGTSWVGYDGGTGTNYDNAINTGATQEEALEYSFKLPAEKLDTTIDSIVQEIDSIKFNQFNTVRVGESPAAGTSFTITHNLGTVFVDVRIQREDAGKWYFDVLPTQVVDANTVKVESSENTKIRYMIMAIEGFDVNQATDLVIL